MNEDTIDAEFTVVDLPEHASKFSNIRWRTKEGELIAIKDMDDKHLRNVAMFLMGFGYQRCVAIEPVRIAWLSVLKKEWEKRLYMRQSGYKKWNVKEDRILLFGEVEGQNE